MTFFIYVICFVYVDHMNLNKNISVLIIMQVKYIPLLNGEQCYMTHKHREIDSFYYLLKIVSIFYHV